MTADFKKGISTGLIMYFVFAVITVVTHLATGWDYAHAPPISFAVIMIALVVGIVRFFTCIWRITSDNKKGKAKGELSVHATILGLFLVMILILSQS